jgi:hypothetical protein
MKNINTFDQYINEAINEELYHFAVPDVAAKILATNKLMGTYVVGTYGERSINRDKAFAISFSRSKSVLAGFGSSYGKPASGQIKNLAVINFDKRGINNHGKLIPVDYWEGAASGWDQDEMEDRLITNRPYISNITKYINEIHVLIRSKDTSDVSRLASQANKNDIPIFVHTDPKDFNYQRKTSQSNQLAKQLATGIDTTIDFEGDELLYIIAAIQGITHGDSAAHQSLISKLDQLMEPYYGNNNMGYERDAVIDRPDYFPMMDNTVNNSSSKLIAISNIVREIEQYLHRVSRSGHPVIKEMLFHINNYIRKQGVKDITALITKKFNIKWE